jgi:hypothetical protein
MAFSKPMQVDSSRPGWFTQDFMRTMHAETVWGWPAQGKVAGVAFSKLTQADNVGYIIAWKIVAHFLREFEQYSTFRGCCSVGFRWQDMENTHMREHYKVLPT